CHGLARLRRHVSPPFPYTTLFRSPFFARQTRLTFARCGVTDPLDLAAYEALGGLNGLRRALSLPPAEIVAEVTKSGRRGRGGAKIGRAHVELQSRENLLCRLLLAR